jgi:SAM-dependent MidA family methyltransferase
MNTTLPIPPNQALALSEILTERIQREIAENSGWIDFATFMHLALYAPDVGYYSGGAKKFGHGGDFVTAPEISPLFAHTLARQAAQVLQSTRGDILELGAGTGRLAAELLLELDRLETLPGRYLILEVSADLCEVQKQALEKNLPTELMARVQWLDEMPGSFKGLIVGNEVLDALPVHLIKTTGTETLERGVSTDENGFCWVERPLADQHLQALLQALDLPRNYLTELCPAANGLIATLSHMLDEGVILLIDYGFPQREYYHPQRSQGTLMCHYQHYAHDNPFLYPGLQDITAHVDFTGIAQTAVANGMALKGYSGQAQFLINCGITEILARTSPDDVAAYAPRASEAQKLLSPAEMGELFKVIAFGKKCEYSLLGFSRGDRSHTL